MAVPDAPALPRIPKLKYRNHLPTHESPLPSPTSSTFTPRSYADSHYSEPLLSPVSFSFDLDRPTSDSRSTTSFTSTTPSLASSHGAASQTSKTPKKNKMNAVFGFLTLKEPSQSALEQYAESLRNQTAKGTAPPTAAFHSVPYQKLPKGVPKANSKCPKANSKWDGVPEVHKSLRTSISTNKRDGSSSRNSGAASHDNSLNVSAFSVGSMASHGPPNSLASPTSSMTDVGRTCGIFDGTEKPSRLRTHPSRPKHAGLSTQPHWDSPSSLPEMSYYFPDGRQTPTTSTTSPNEKTRNTSTSGQAEACSSVGAESDECRPHSAFSAHTASSDCSLITRADALFKRLQGNGAFLAGEAQEVNLGEECESPDAVPDTHDFLFEVQSLSSDAHPQASSSACFPLVENSGPAKSPTATNFSSPRPRPSLRSPSASYVQASPLPTVYESPMLDNASAANVETATTESIEAIPDAISSVTTPFKDVEEPTIARPSSSRERLGLGGRIRRNDKEDALPWENQAILTKCGRGRRSLFSKSSA